MIQTNARALSPHRTTGVAITSMWKVLADSTYDVIIGWKYPRELVALRTISGEGTIYFRDKTAVTVNGGTFILFEHQDVLRYHTKGAQWNFWWSEFDVDDHHQFPLNQLMSVPVIEHESTELDTCFQLIKKNHVKAHRLASSILLMHIHRHIYQGSIGEQPAFPHVEAVERVIQAIYDNMNTLTIPRMAKIACLSERRFREVFQTATGKTPKIFYDTIRIDKAAEALIIGKDSIAHIAEQFGYSSVFHFSKAFKKRTGMAPSQYRLDRITR